MSKKVYSQRQKRKQRNSNKIRRNSNRLRLCIRFANKNMSAQVINDIQGHTVFCVSSLQADVKAKLPKTYGTESAIILGQLVADKCKDYQVEQVVLDRGHKKYHGLVKAFAEEVRKKISV
jgi:large subunit ribosomal protein L18